MLWKVRTTLPDRPGALATLATACGRAEVNILALHVFPGIEAVTDELVLRTPEKWSLADVVALIEGADCVTVGAMPCTEAALADQSTRFVQAARAILAQPAGFPEIVAGLFDAEADPPHGTHAALDVLEMTVGEVAVAVHRATPFTATEHARAAAMAGLVSDVLGRTAAAARPGVPAQTDRAGGLWGRRIGVGVVPEFTVEGDAVLASVDGQVVGSAVLLLEAVEAGLREVRLSVDPAWQRRGIGTRLLVDVARLASGRSAQEILIVTGADNQAVLPMVLSAGLRGRIRMAADVLTVRVPVRELKPLDR
ncbi:MAG: GNAT family N-acetyltransferase [Nocardioides sp.]